MAYQDPPKILLTPGPLTTDDDLKYAMLKDLGSRDSQFIGCLKWVREQLIRLASPSFDHNSTNLVHLDLTSVILPGSGTYGVESVLATAIEPNSKILICINGAYGKRIQQMCQHLGHNYQIYQVDEKTGLDPDEINKIVTNDYSINSVVLVHCETTTGIINPLSRIAYDIQNLKRYRPKLTLIVDAMSSFGGIPLDCEDLDIDYLITSANKCLESVPGVAIILAKKSRLGQINWPAKSLSLNLVNHWKSQEYTGQCLYTPPIQVILALQKGIEYMKLEAEIMSFDEPVLARFTRYYDRYRTVLNGMKKLGFRPYLEDLDDYDPNEFEEYDVLEFENNTNYNNNNSHYSMGTDLDLFNTNSNYNSNYNLRSNRRNNEINNNVIWKGKEIELCEEEVFDYNNNRIQNRNSNGYRGVKWEDDSLNSFTELPEYNLSKANRMNTHNWGKRGPIITTFHWHPSWKTKYDWNEFYESMREGGYVLYPGKLTQANTFRIGHIGTFDDRVLNDLLTKIRIHITHTVRRKVRERKRLKTNLNIKNLNTVA